ncbi:hypothetical protein [Xylanibacter brevis]|uniref:hypothetical protein n=1 Tax=Xylanibacter brevis TaxID=83231 RepID=UPI000482CF7B|nr:hypothetical protein [Xylanibacter brevis]
MIEKKLFSTAIHYSIQLLIIECVLFAGFLLMAPPTTLVGSVAGICATSFFYLLCGWIWYMVASRHHDYLTSFYTGTSGFRFMMALAVIGIYYMTANEPDMKTFICVFGIYYLVTLIHFSIFFSRVSNRS